jgi:hypothetical protein
VVAVWAGRRFGDPLFVVKILPGYLKGNSFIDVDSPAVVEILLAL